MGRALKIAQAAAQVAVKEGRKVIVDEDVYAVLTEEMLASAETYRKRDRKMRWNVRMLVDPFMLNEASIYAQQSESEAQQSESEELKYSRCNFARFNRLLKRPVTKKQYWYISRICIALCEYAMLRGSEDVYVKVLEDRIMKLEDRLKLLRHEVMSGKQLIAHYSAEHYSAEPEHSIGRVQKIW